MNSTIRMNDNSNIAIVTEDQLIVLVAGMLHKIVCFLQLLMMFCEDSFIESTMHWGKITGQIQDLERMLLEMNDEYKKGK